ncbi:hypothetical protein OQ496_02225 [Acetobacter suratthaniensis]|uniref:Glycosyltransferase RgtA/B/C/D-like domain-containing protein n=1 Tax=Acetobacter suratthaniensis TaxID=1502841 RepID=A0ABS3LHS5_9PROT|nr:hypothetical protein [Acetobacter suratthaniensis]MBO1327119.1 hypothetical protein [Acetobacter suratthaniensis]MCX2565270.1 hypothetical protein [Acetobacter suratthaniensis]
MKNVNYVFYAVIFIITLIASFLRPIYNWDLDHEMYFGSRLLSGELLWTKEFHDKLPFVALIFLVPAYFKSVFVFKIISIFSICIFSFSLCAVSNKIFTKKGRSNEGILFSALMFFLLLYFSYDSITTINCIAVSFYGTSFLLILYDNFYNKIRTIVDRSLVLFFASGLGAMAVSIRPYYIASLGVTLVGSIVFSQGNSQAGERLFTLRKCLKISIWGAAIGVWGGVLNILPYALTGQISAFHDGLLMLGSHINPLSAVHDFFDRMRKFPDILLWGSWIFMIIFVFFCKKESNEYKIFWISMFSALAMGIYIISNHYWWHYIQLFFANYCICVLSVLSLVQAPNGLRIPFSKIEKIRMQFLYRVFLALFCIFVLFDLKKEAAIAENIKNEDTAFWKSTSYNWKEDLFRDYLQKNYVNSRPSFLFPDDMKAHWLLGEERYHFPHSANTQQVFLGWWKNITFRSAHFFVISNGEQYCEKIRSNGPELVVVQPDSLLLPCMKSAASGYQLQDTLENSVGKIMIFRREVQP